MEIKRDKILITGATGHVGHAIAMALALPDTQISLCFRSNEDRALRLKAKLSEICEVHLIESDLALIGAPEKVVDDCTRKMGGLNLLVHCAAILEKTPLGTVTTDQWEMIVNTNLRASFFLAQAVSMRMQTETGGGSMIFISDVAASRPYGAYLPYSISKAGVDNLVKGLARTLAPNVTVNAVAPYIVTRPAGITDQGWQQILDKTSMHRATTAEEIAEVIKTLAKSETITGQVISIDGGRLLR